MIDELKPIIILGAPGGGTSYFTKFLRRCNFYAGKSIEDGRGKVNHIGSKSGSTILTTQA